MINTKQVHQQGSSAKNKPLHPLSPRGKKILTIGGIVVGAVLMAGVAVLLIWNPWNTKKQLVRELNTGIQSAQNAEDLMIVSNMGFTFTQNGKENKTVVQGAYLSTGHKQKMLLKGSITYTSSINPANNYQTDFEVLKKDQIIYEKVDGKYQKSRITSNEFSDLEKNFRIFTPDAAQLKDIRKSDSVDKNAAIYEATLSDLPKSLKEDYLDMICKITDEKLTLSDLRFGSGTLVSSLSAGALKSQQLRIAVTVTTKTNSFSIGFISEINLNNDAKTVRQQLQG